MGSYCSIHFDELSVCSNKSHVPDAWAVLFQESDRIEEFRRHEDQAPDEEPYCFIIYRTDRETFCRRLSLLGATDAAMRDVFNMWLNQEREDWKRYAKDWADENGVAKELAEALASLDFESWKSYANQALRTRYNFSDPYKPKNRIEEQFHHHSDSYLDIAAYGDLLTIRALLEACVDVKFVSLDVTDLVDGGYYDRDQPICVDARRNLQLTTQPLGPTVICAEGSTDIIVLEQALRAMHPALTGYFSFFNHSEFSVDGGAAYLVKFLKAFAAAKISSRILAVFDNDTIGVQAYDQATALGLPPNFILSKLPDIELARMYPTIGPSGATTLDVNGSAGSIELYLGHSALMANENFRPVRWKGYVEAAQKYQGEVYAKDKILAAYFNKIRKIESPVEARLAFPELEQIWQSIFDLVEHQAGEQYLHGYQKLLEEGA